jgi:hypothetical protein
MLHRRPRPLSLLVDAPRRRSSRGWLVTLVALGTFGGCASATSGEVCRSGDPTPGCVDEVGGVTLVTTCGAADVSGIQSCDVVSAGQTLEALCGAPEATSGCALGGDARRVTGTIEETTGVLLDQGGGTLTVSIPDLAPSEVELSSGLTIEILAAAAGAGPVELTVTPTPCTGCPGPSTVTVGHTPAWIPVAEVSAEGGGTLTLSGAGVEIDDLRMTGATERVDPSSQGCGRAPDFGIE